eukprot:4973888-Pleurochrysis_carterae.AAC.1
MARRITPCSSFLCSSVFDHVRFRILDPPVHTLPLPVGDRVRGVGPAARARLQVQLRGAGGSVVALRANCARERDAIVLATRCFVDAARAEVSPTST